MEENNEYYEPNDDLEDSLKKNDEQGENYPSYAEIHIKLLINRERTDMIQKLLQADMPPITSDDTINWVIDCEIYNAECRRTMLYEPLKITKKVSKKKPTSKKKPKRKE